MNIIKNLLVNNLIIYHNYLKFKNIFNKLFYSDMNFLIKSYKKTHGEEPDLLTPKTFSEKLVWSMLNHRNNIYIECSDKYTVREYVKEKIGEEYLIKCIGIYRNVNEINFNLMPNSFVLKATHASGWNLIVQDKTNLDIKKTKRILNYWFSNNYFNFNREWPYKFMEHRVICEEFIGSNDGKPPLDYKIFCFNGQPRIIQVDINRFENHLRNVYDIEWNHLTNVEIAHKQDFQNLYNKPKNLDEMLDIAMKLSKNMEHVRIDLYNIDGKIYFGEMTFFHGAGIFEYFRPKEFHLEIGSWFKLPEKNI